jgi:hypothetical protein
VARHGPMVLSVCRCLLRDQNDAEDASALGAVSRPRPKTHDR